MTARWIDCNDFGQFCERETPPESVTIYAKMARSAFHKWRRRAPWVLRLHTFARVHFSGRGSWHIDAMMEILARNGYGTSREARRRILDLLRAAPQWFTDMGDGYFSQKSWRKIVGVTRFTGDRETVTLDLLEKRNAAQWRDLLICLNARGQIGPVENIGNQTGYHRTRLYGAFKSHGEPRERVRCPVGYYQSKCEALEARGAFWRQGTLTEVYQDGEHFILTVCAGVAFTGKDADATGRPHTNGGKRTKRKKTAPESGKATRTTTVFRAAADDFRTLKNAFTGESERFLFAQFLNIDAGDLFFQRHRRSANNA